MFNWFYESFGFNENEPGTFKSVRNKFELVIPPGDPHGTILNSKVNERKFAVGKFDTPSVQELHEQFSEAVAARPPSQSGLQFLNLKGDVRSLILNPNNAGAVFQAASQFNCLEMVGPSITPEKGVTGYFRDRTQGPICAIACPAATIVRNYFAGAKWGSGQAGGNQLNMMHDIAQLLDNNKHQYWEMKNGYLLPKTNSSLSELQKRLQDDGELRREVTRNLRVGIHWGTETEKRFGHEPHTVCQVFSSAVPVAYAKGTRKKDWEQLACAVLDGTFEAAIAAGAILAVKRDSRVKVYLTCVGGGVFGNSNVWIASAIKRAIKIWKEAPVDVKLVHYQRMPGDIYRKIKSP